MKKVQYTRIIIQIALIALACISIFPFYVMIINATHSNIEITRDLNLLPGDDMMDNYRTVVSQIDIWRGFLNSLIITVPSVLLSVYFGALTGYGFSKYQFKGNKILFGVVLATLMIPMQLGLIGYYQLHSKLRLLDTFFPLILPWIAHPTTVFFLKMYIDSAVPNELINAARVDGAREFYIFNRLVFPILIPAVATMGIFNFVTSWNNYIMPLTLLFTKAKFPLPVLVSMLKGIYNNNYGAIYLGVSISVVPIILVFSFLSKRIMGGLTVGALKG